MIKHTSVFALFVLLLECSIAAQYTPSFAWVTGRGDSSIYSWNYTQTGIVQSIAGGGDYQSEGLAALLVATDYSQSTNPYDILLIGSNGTLYNISHFQAPVPTWYLHGQIACNITAYGIPNYNGLLFAYSNSLPLGLSIQIIDPKTGLNWNYLMPNKGSRMGGNVCKLNGPLKYDITGTVPNATGIGFTNLMPTPAPSTAAYILDAQWTSPTPGALVLSSFNPTTGTINNQKYPLGITISPSTPVAFTIADLWGNNTGWLAYGNKLYSVNLSPLGGVGLNHTIQGLGTVLGNNIAVLPVGFFPSFPKPTKMPTPTPTPIPIPSSFDITTIAVVVLVLVVVVVLYRRTQRGRGGQRGAHRD